MLQAGEDFFRTLLKHTDALKLAAPLTMASIDIGSPGMSKADVPTGLAAPEAELMWGIYASWMNPDDTNKVGFSKTDH